MLVLAAHRWVRYRYRRTVLTPGHNPAVARLPNGTLALFSILQYGVHTAPSPDGNWTYVKQAVDCKDAPQPLCYCNNPAPWVHSNGTIYLSCGGGGRCVRARLILCASRLVCTTAPLFTLQAIPSSDLTRLPLMQYISLQARTSMGSGAHKTSPVGSSSWLDCRLNGERTRTDAHTDPATHDGRPPLVVSCFLHPLSQRRGGEAS